MDSFQVSAKKVERLVLPTSSPVTSTPPLDKGNDQQAKEDEKILTLEEEQAAITARNEQEERERMITKHHKLAVKANNMGVFHERIGRLDKSLQCYQVALKAIHETKTFSLPPKQSFSSLPPSVIPEDPKTPIVLNVSADEILLRERSTISVIVMSNLGSLYRRNGKLGRAMEFYNLAFSAACALDGSATTTSSQQLQDRMMDYIECNVALVRDEDEFGLYEEEDEEMQQTES
jgi:tetratricopeptide (TPR) repeat protein